LRKKISMKSSRRFGSEDSAVRAKLLDATEQLMLEEGYAAVTSRRLAAKAGLKQPLVYYYFRTMDELFLAVFRRMTEQSFARLDEALKAEEPIRALWNLNSDHSRTALTIEFLALANHRKVVQAEIARVAEQFRSTEVTALTRLFAQRGIVPQIPSLVVAVLLTSLARGLVQEGALGISKGHASTQAFVEACLRYFEESSGAYAPVVEMIRAQQPKARKSRAKPRARRAARLP
jgi:AcrR family transcriptional regulator